MIDSKLVATIVATEPLLGYYLIRSQIVSDSALPAEAAIEVTDGIIRLIINPEKFGACPESMQIGIVLHEYLHALLLHCDKRALGSRDEAWMANIAQDMAINPIIKLSWDLPVDAVMPSGCGYEFPAFRSSEFYFEQLASDKPRFAATFGEPPVASPPNLSCLQEIAAEFLAGGNEPAQGLVGDSKKILVQLDRATRRLNWKNQLRRFVKSARTADRIGGGRRFSRRLGFPYPGTQLRRQPYVPVVLDTSASMADWLQEILEELAVLSRTTDLLLYQCDNRLRSSKRLNGNQVEICGLTGTDLQPALDRCHADGCRRVLIASDRKFERPLNLHGMRASWLEPGVAMRLE